MSSCEKKDNNVIDPVLRIPVIDTAGLTPNNFDTSNIHMSVFAHVVSDVPITKVTANVFNPTGNQVASIILSDAGNKRYTGEINFSMDCRMVGIYRVEFTALSNQNLYSSVYPLNFSDSNTHNHPPVISNLIISPKDFVKGVPTNLTFLVNASDAEGQCDIKTVHYFGKYPNRHDNLTEHGLYDDGSCCLVETPPSYSGDTTANDGKYTRFFGGARADSLGYFVYHIIAIDYSGDTSNILSDSIFVHN